MSMNGLSLRQARREDLAAIVALLADDALSASRAGHTAVVTPSILSAFEEIERDSGCELWVAELDVMVVGTWQLDIIPGLSRGGMRRAQLEAVRVCAGLRGRGIGAAMLRHAIERAASLGCGLMQLTTDQRREDAHRFYRRYGFVASHAGMKLTLPVS